MAGTEDSTPESFYDGSTWPGLSTLRPRSTQQPPPKDFRELYSRRSASLTIGSALPNEVSVEFVVNVDLHIVHPINLERECKEGSVDKRFGPQDVPGH